MIAKWADHSCAICFATTGDRNPADESWPYMPLCRAHIIQSGGIIDSSTDVKRRSRPALTVIEGGRT